MGEGTSLMEQLHGGMGSVSGKGEGKGMPALLDKEADAKVHKDDLDKRYVQLGKTIKLAEKHSV